MVYSELGTYPQRIGGAFGRVVRSDAGGHGWFWMVFIFPKCVKNTNVVSNQRLKECQNTKIFRN